MPSFNDEIVVRASRSDVWSFVKDVDNWAHLFPGYQRHLLEEEDHYFWQLRGEAGVWSRLVEFDVYVTDWADPDHVAFSIDARTEPVVGTGRFYTRANDSEAGTSIMGFELDAHATGSAAPMINALLKKFVTEQSGPFLNTLGDVVTATSDPVGHVVLPATVPSAPGIVVVEYRAPRTAEFEHWLRATYVPALLARDGVRRVQRYELSTVGAVGEYRELIETRDMRGTLEVHAQVCDDAGAAAAGMELLDHPYSMRRIHDDRRRRFGRRRARTQVTTTVAAPR